MADRDDKGRFIKGHPGLKKLGSRDNLTVKTRLDMWKYIHSLESDGKTVANPFKVLIHTMINTKDEHIKVTCATKIAQKLLPDLKAVQLQMTPSEAQQRLAALLGVQEPLTLEAGDIKVLE